MSNHPSEPGNAACAPPLKREPGQPAAAQDGDQGKTPRWPQPPPRTKSTSLLTQALQTLDEEEGQSANTSTGLGASGPRPHHPHAREDREAHNGINTNRSGPSSTNQMAVVASLTAQDLRASSLGSTPTTVNNDFNFHDMGSVNSLLLGHREFLNNAKGRGTSLERTDKERRVQNLPKANFSTNFGDTGMTSPPLPLAAPTPGSISNKPPTEGVRAEYRSWRDARPSAAANKTWSIGGQASDDDEVGQVEKSVTEALAGTERNNRSRKASHSLRFFKEGLPDTRPKLKDTKGRGHSKEEVPRLKEVGGSDNIKAEQGKEDAVDGPPSVQPTESKTPQRSPSELQRSSSKSSHSNPIEGLAPEEGYFDVSHTIETVTEEQLKTMPAQLLAEIRKHHNLTPGASKGSSFSRSIPVTEVERPKILSNDESYHLASAHAEDHSRAGHVGSKVTEEEDDSGEEQIASALFVPHKTPHESPERDRNGFDKPRRNEQENNSDTQEWLEEHEVPSRDIDEKYLSQEPKSKPLPSPSVVEKSEQFDEKKKTPMSTAQDFSDVERPSLDDNGYITADEEFSATDDGETTPTGSLIPRIATGDEYKPREADNYVKTKPPLEAVELIPYKHQVGGHTTMWRFSKRAVCKQLNNRENEFYEKVESYHPKLLKFLPRYIGVLNVTFEKQARRKSSKKEGVEGSSDRQDSATENSGEAIKNGVNGAPTSNGHAASGERVEHHRVISQSLSTAQPVPTVTFLDNRHIIPSSFMKPLPHFIDNEYRSLSDNVTTSLSAGADGSRSLGQPINMPERPGLAERHAQSWGKTNVNKDLRTEVFSEAFQRQPIPIQRHKRPASQGRSGLGRPNRDRDLPNLRSASSESSLRAAQHSQACGQQPGGESIRKKAIRTAAERNSALSPLVTPERPLRNGVKLAECDDDVEDVTGTSAPEPEISRGNSPNGKRKRRYSSGGLRRKPLEVSNERGNLKWYEEADDAGYKGDAEEDVFPMDLDSSQGVNPQTVANLVAATNSLNISEDAEKEEKPEEPIPDTESNGNVGVGSMLPAAPGTPKFLDVPRPVNPKEAQTQQGSRVEYFLLLEDLTAGMKRPCIMDLKMGTRQYGVEADEKKQKSQRSKCASTTSKELGVRVCGLQVWDAKTQTYHFQDKYFGRDLKVGAEFKDALTRFLYDGIDYSSVLRHIPTILDRLSQLEILIRQLKGYRFYAASLLMFYDGELQVEDASDSAATEKDVRRKGQEIDFKIADFANCVTKEDVRSGDRPCPPRHPDLPDYGFLRGLRSLKTYFLAIQRDIRKQMGIENFHNGGGGEAIGEYDDVDDEGGISY